MTPAWDDAVVGAGIVGLALAHALARRERRVIVFERDEQPRGASVRNFGMLWPIGQPAGPRRELAQRSLRVWHEVLAAAGLWHDRCGSLHLAYRDDEAQVLAEFAQLAAEHAFPGALLDPPAVAAVAPLVRRQHLRSALWSPSETCVDPRQVLATLPRWLHDRWGVHFELGRPVLGYDRPAVRTSSGTIEAGRLWVCSGDDLRTLYPEVFQAADPVLCKLQMMRTEPLRQGTRIGPMLAGGLTLRHYAAFALCPSLPALRARVAAETPAFDRYGIHVMAAQNGLGEIVIGDSHEYGAPLDVFDKAEIETLVLDYLSTFLELPADLRIAARWHGSYVKLANEPYLVTEPAEGATIVACLGGAGMTLSFGLAEQTVAKLEARG
jgi:FAD dependent oxidoreductase TIGR03364